MKMIQHFLNPTSSSGSTKEEKAAGGNSKAWRGVREQPQPHLLILEWMDCNVQSRVVAVCWFHGTKADHRLNESYDVFATLVLLKIYFIFIENLRHHKNLIFTTAPLFTSGCQQPNPGPEMCLVPITLHGSHGSAVHRHGALQTLRQLRFQSKMTTEIRKDVRPTRSFVTWHDGNDKDDPFMVGRCIDGVDWISDDVSLQEIIQLLYLTAKNLINTTQTDPNTVYSHSWSSVRNKKVNHTMSTMTCFKSH